MRAWTAKGFTIIELLIAVAVVGVLLAVAMPAYQDHVRRSNRAEAIEALTRVQQNQERRRANEPSYTSDLSLLGVDSSTRSGLYTLEIDAADATGYTVTATVVSSSSQGSDARCNRMRLQMLNGNIRYISACATCTIGTTDSNRCWVRQ
jgi:type IV pilus assembly protein PilE